RRSAVPIEIPQTHALLSQISQELRQEAPAHNAAQCSYSKFGECVPIGQATAARRAVRNLKGLPKGRAALPGGPPFDKSVHITSSPGPRVCASAIASSRNRLREVRLRQSGFR